ncbi:MAG: hypothetical protein HRU36_03705 [Rickettsiales bacterium]|nr:hypothetical protein [Rickettsiales bacterium]
MSYFKLEKEFERYGNLNNIKSILDWDTNVNLPQNSLFSREKQINYIDDEINNFLRDKYVGSLLKNVRKEKLNKWQQRNLELMIKATEENKIYPEKLLESISISSMRCESLWRKAKSLNQFAIVKDALESLLLLIKEKSDRRGEWLQKSNYQTLVDVYSPGLKLDTINRIFNELKEKIALITPQLNEDNTVSHNSINLKNKYEFNIVAEIIAKEMGFDFNGGRIDFSVHPFCGGHPQDIRVTHHYDGSNFISALYAIIHEVGHGLYEQNLPKKLNNQLVGQACGYAAHEGSSLLHEFFIGKSKYFLEKIDKIISKYVNQYEQKSLVSEVRKVLLNNSIRVNADMVTYPLHIILRYELEKMLFDGSLKVEEIPECWRQKHEELFGFKINSDTEGCLQDIHWYMGLFGYFPSYCIGLIYAAQMYYLIGFNSIHSKESFKQKFYDLKVRFYENGSLYEFEDLVEKCTGKTLTTEYYYEFIHSEYLKSSDKVT